ncbi:MAG: hypothetical protein AAF352_02965 [Pseudomonadota bacterium]
MKRWMMFFIFPAIVLTIVVDYNISYEIRRIKAQNQQLRADIAHAQDTINVLQAEWTYLSRAERIEELVAKHMPHLQPLDPKIHTLDDQSLRAFVALQREQQLGNAQPVPVTYQPQE